MDLLINFAHQLNDLSLDLNCSAAPEGNTAIWQPVQAECSQKGFCCGLKDDSEVLVTLEHLSEFWTSVMPLAQARPSSRSKPSGHSQSKEPRVFTQLDPMGQGSFAHSSTSERLKQR